jgi:hypothetical protein
MKVAKEYGWAMAQATGQSYCGKLSFSAVDSGFQLDSLTHAHISDRMNTESGLRRKYCVSRSVSVILYCFEMAGLRVNWIREADVLIINITGRSNLSFSLLVLPQKAIIPDRDSQDSGDLTLL